jgi:uncharacterized protein
MECRLGCGACCIAPSIRGPLPGMPEGKPAGARCANLDEGNLCRLWGTEALPAVCRSFPPMPDACGSSAKEAMVLLTVMERVTAP